MQLLPGNGTVGKVFGLATGLTPLKAIGDALSPNTPGAPASPPPPPTRQDPAIGAASKAQKLAERKRKGRRATILTSGRGLEDQLGSVSRPEARSAELLGG